MRRWFFRQWEKRFEQVANKRWSVSSQISQLASTQRHEHCRDRLKTFAECNSRPHPGAECNSRTNPDAECISRTHILLRNGHCVKQSLSERMVLQMKTNGQGVRRSRLTQEEITALSDYG